MLPLPAATEALYDSTGRHLAGCYAPLMEAGALTPAHAACVATRPAESLVWDARFCPDPLQHLGLVWMLPASPGVNPLTVSPAVLPYLVQALDAGCSVKMHAGDLDAINTVCAAVAPLLGGGHA